MTKRERNIELSKRIIAKNGNLSTKDFEELGIPFEYFLIYKINGSVERAQKYLDLVNANQ